MDRLLIEGLPKLLDLVQKFKNRFMFFKRRRCFYFYIPVGLSDFINNSGLKDRIFIVKLDEVLSSLLPEADLKTFNDCLTKAFSQDRELPEPYRSICVETLKRVVEHYISTYYNGKKILFITDDDKLYDLLSDMKRKFVMLPSIDVINRDLGDIEHDNHINSLKIIISLEEKCIYRSKVFKSIPELDNTIMELLKLKKRK